MSPALTPSLLGPRLHLQSPDRVNHWRVAVDLSLLRAGGENGGVKPFIYEYLREFARREGDRVTFIFLTWSNSHHEVRELARPHDEMVCVRHLEPGFPSGIGNWRDGETYLPRPPKGLLLHVRANLLYSPLGSPEFACPGIPTLSTIVDLLHRDYPATLDPHIVQVRENLFQELVRCTNRYQCISHHTASRLAACYNIPPAQTFCSHIAIHERLGSAASAGEAPADTAPYFFYPANFWRHKNHETLFVAYRLYLIAHPHEAWPLVLTGHADARMERLKSYAESLGIAHQVRFAGHLADDEFAALWRDAGVLVFPSLHEGFGIPLVEAMHFGIPLLCSREGSLPEVAGDAALYADTRDPLDLARALGQIAGDAELRRTLRDRGRARLATFSLTDEIDEFQRQMRETTASPARRWHQGLHPDGWIEEQALFGLPAKKGRLQIKMTFKPAPAARVVRFYRGLIPLGGIAVPATAEQTHHLITCTDGHPLRIEVANAANLSPTDHRVHGVIIGTIVATDEAGVTYDLTEDEA